MPTFQYAAADQAHKKQKGFIEAESRARAYTLLTERGLVPLTLTPVDESGRRGRSLLPSLRRLLPGSGIRLAESFYYLGVLLQSGHSLAKSLELIGRMSGTQASKVWLSVRDRVEEGEPFSQALSRHGALFPGVYVGMIKVAEGAGRLGQVLESIADNEERRAEVQGRLVTALVYPGVICCVGMGAVYFLLSNVLPKIAGIFSAAKGKLPASTTLLLAVGQTLENLGPAGLLLPVLLVLLAALAFRRFSGLAFWKDRLLWRLPLVHKYMLARFSGLLGFQIEAGIPLVQALESSAEAVASRFFKDKIIEARDEVAAGRPLDRVLDKQGIYPEVYILTLSSGQKVGQLGPFLLRLAHILEREVDNVLKRLVALAEPLLILAVGLVIAFIVVAIMEPIFNLTTLVR
ncbi:MAG: type II secretion system F family protein [Thermodesulfobacteriota bacterium]